MKNGYFLFLMTMALLTGCAQFAGRSRYTEEDVKRANIGQSKAFNVDTSSLLRIDLNEALEGDLINETDVLDTMLFIPLETTPESIIAYPSKIMMTDDRIFVLDSEHNIVIFDNNGRYISSLKKGQGPGEINKLMSVSYNYLEQQLMVIQNKWIMYYDKDGNPIDKGIKCAFTCKEFAAIPSGFIFFHFVSCNRHLGPQAEKALFLTNSDMNILNTGIDVLSQNNVICCIDNITRYNGSYFISQFYNDTIFCVSENGGPALKAKYLLDYSSCKAPDSESEDRVGKFYNNGSVLENATSQIFFFTCIRKGIFVVVRDKGTGHTMGGYKFDCDGFPEYLASAKTQHGEYFVSVLQPFKGMECSSPAVSPESNAKLKGLTEEDNPVLVLYKLKQF